AVRGDVTLQHLRRHPAALAWPTCRRLIEDIYDRQTQALLQLLQLLAENDVFPGHVGIDQEQRLIVAAVGQRAQHADHRRDPDAANNADGAGRTVGVAAERAVRAVQVGALAWLSLLDGGGEITQLPNRHGHLPLALSAGREREGVLAHAEGPIP